MRATRLERAPAPRRRPPTRAHSSRRSSTSPRVPPPDGRIRPEMGSSIRHGVTSPDIWAAGSSEADGERLRVAGGGDEWLLTLVVSAKGLLGIKTVRVRLK